MLKKITIIFIIALAVFGLTARAFCYNSEVTDISGTKYFPAVKEALAKAEKNTDNPKKSYRYVVGIIEKIP